MDELKDRCGGDSYEFRFNGYYLKPNRYSDVKSLLGADERAAEDIARLESAINDIREYRKQLAARAAQLETMASHKRVSLKREKRDNVVFYLSVDVVYEDGTEANDFRKVYVGKERRAAIAAYNKFVKAHPRWERVKDIEKGWWEK